jgi:hypothetical protein
MRCGEPAGVGAGPWRETMPGGLVGDGQKPATGVIVDLLDEPARCRR